VLIPITNFGTQVLHIGSDTPLATLENFASVSDFLDMFEQEDVVSTMDGAEQDLPGHMQTLFEKSVTDLIVTCLMHRII
jgi:hypothetical protein